MFGRLTRPYQWNWHLRLAARLAKWLNLTGICLFLSIASHWWRKETQQLYQTIQGCSKCHLLQSDESYQSSSPCWHSCSWRGYACLCFQASTIAHWAAAPVTSCYEYPLHSNTTGCRQLMPHPQLKTIAKSSLADRQQLWLVSFGASVFSTWASRPGYSYCLS